MRLIHELNVEHLVKHTLITFIYKCNFFFLCTKLHKQRDGFNKCKVTKTLSEAKGKITSISGEKTENKKIKSKSAQGFLRRQKHWQKVVIK